MSNQYLNVSDLVLADLDEFIKLLREELAKQRKHAPINDTMKASKSIYKRKIGETDFQVLGAEYIEMLNKGRGNGKRPPISALQKWVQSKLKISDKKEALSVAFAVAKKIEREGTEIFKDNSQGIELSKNVEVFAQKLSKDVSRYLVFEIKEKLNKFAKARQT